MKIRKRAHRFLARVRQLMSELRSGFFFHSCVATDPPMPRLRRDELRGDGTDGEGSENSRRAFGFEFIRDIRGIRGVCSLTYCGKAEIFLQENSLTAGFFRNCRNFLQKETKGTKNRLSHPPNTRNDAKGREGKT